MTWSKLSDDFTDDTWYLSDVAFRLHVEGICWSNRKLLDMQIPKDDASKFKGITGLPELLDKGYWSELHDSFLILHHADYQRTREAVIATQSRNRTNGAKGGRPPGKREVWQGGKTQPLTPDESQKISPKGTQSVSEVSTDQPATKPKNPGMTRERNPVANPVANPKGLALEEVVVTPSSSKQEPRNNIDSAYPTESNAIAWRQRIDTQGITSEAELMEVAKITANQARRMWLAAFPESRAA